MTTDSPIILIGIGTAGASIARNVNRAFGANMRLLLLDTDASTGQPGEPFVLLGGNRLSGHGTGGDVVAGRLAAQALGTAVRIGRPIHVDGLDEADFPPAYASIAGALLYAHRNYEEKSLFDGILGRLFK